ncbi:hypothetical protein [Paraburkholderia nodosa]|uniref:hypothetical protein n=1 Tax=Paraburkholderia nodosa TaxID=392320 RepID=UPI0012B695E3|nr:hypothetical protein [Paraburkholderia nodosa]
MQLQPQPLPHIGMAAPELSIRNASGPVNAQGYTAAIGGRENWTVSSSNVSGAMITGLALVVTPATALVGNYVANDRQGVVTPLAAGADTASFYWATAGIVTIVVTANVNGQPATKTVVATIWTPTLVSYSADTHASRILFKLRRQSDPESGISTLSFGCAGPNEDGIAFTAQVDFPAMGFRQGQLAMAQIFTANRTGTNQTGAPLPPKASPGDIIDREFVYPFTYNGRDYEGPLKITAAGSYTLTSEDSPASALGSSGSMLSKLGVTVDETYRMYVMFRPTGGIWVALGEIVWRWHASATYDAQTFRFVLTVGHGSSENTHLVNSVVFVRMPLWQGNADDYLAEID